MENYGTIWVCVDCMLHHANGECGNCYEGHGEEPLNKIDGDFHVVMGMAYEEHSCGRELHAAYRAGDGEPPPDADLECDCETNTYSTSQCEGCGSYLHGERHAMTLFKETERTYKVIRHFYHSNRKFTVKTGLTLKEAQEHCNDPETSSSTCTSPAGKRRTRRSGPWFDGWTEEK